MPEVTTVARRVGTILEYAGLRFLIIAIAYGAAGGAALLLPGSAQRKTVAIVVLTVACVAFLFVPICWDPKSDDCRSIVTRVSDGLSALVPAGSASNSAVAAAFGPPLA
jgi:hypothetical protein